MPKDQIVPFREVYYALVERDWAGGSEYWPWWDTLMVPR